MVNISPTAAGNLLVVGANWSYAVSPAVSDNKGQKWTQLAADTGYSGGTQTLWYAENTAAGVTSLSFTFSGFPGQAHAIFAEYSGVAKTASSLGRAFSNQNGSFKATEYSSGNLTIRTGSALLLGFTNSYYGASSYQWAAGSAFTIQA